MIQEQLNFDIISSIQEKLDLHAGDLEVLSDLLKSVDEDDNPFDKPNFGQNLGSLIYTWLYNQNRIIEEAIEQVKNEPKYVLHNANELLNLARRWKGRNKLSDFIGSDDIIERLENTIDIYGDAYRSEAESLLKDLREIQEKEVTTITKE